MTSAELIPSLGEEELDANLAAMHDAQVTFPVTVMAATVSRRVSLALSDAMRSADKLVEFFLSVKPWTVARDSSESWPPIDRSTWRLGLLVDLPEKEAIRFFNSTCFDSFLVPLLEGWRSEITVRCN